MLMLTKKVLAEKLEAFYQAAATDKKTLDIGSRKGRHSAYFSNIVTIDIDPKADPDIVADAHELPFADESFEVVLCREVLEHVKEPTVVLKEIKRVLKPGGTLYLSTRFLFPLHEIPNDHWRFTKYCLEELFSSFNGVTIKEETKPMLAVACLLQRLAWQTEFKHFGKIIKGLILVLAYAFSKLDGIIAHQYGDVRKDTIVENAFTTGYYIVAKK